MKKITSFLLIFTLLFTFCLTGCAAAESNEGFTLSMQIDNPIMTVNGAEKEIDEGRGTVPVVINDRTLVPIRAIIEAVGGMVSYDDDTQTVFLEYNGDFVTLAIGNTTAYFNETPNTLDVEPTVINERTMLPIRFIAESFKFNVDWTGETQTITITKNSAVSDPTQNVASTEFDLEKGTVKLNSGYEMPILGIGTYQLTLSQAEESVYNALKEGYRLIDTANIYMNEKGVGRGIKRSGVPREEIFITTKLWVSEYEDTEKAIEDTLKRLDTDYIDLLLLHQPYGNYTEGYKGMEKAVAEGKVKSIGLSNFYEEKFDEVIKTATIKPAVLQNETHPYFQETAMKEHIKPYGTIMESWFPLGGRGNTQKLFNDETISSIAKAHNKTSAQIILRWHLQAGNIAIPGSSNAAHIQENYEIFDFSLTDDEMKKISALDDTGRFFVMSDEDAENWFTSSNPDFNNQE